MLANLLATLRTRMGERSIRADTLQIYSLQVVTLGFGMVSSVIVARTLGPSEKGVIDLFRVLTSFILDFGLLGFGSGLLYYLANRQEPLARVHGTGLAFAAAIGMTIAAIGLLGRPWLMQLFPGLPTWMFALAVTLAPFAFYFLIWSNIMTGLNRAVISYRMSAAFTAINLVAILLLWASKQLTPATVVLVIEGIAVANAIVAFVIIYRIEPRLVPNLALAQASLRYSWVIYLSFLANMLHFKVDQLMIGAWLSTADLGVYAISVRWAEMLFLLDSALIAASLYKISSSSAATAFALTQRILKTQLLISGVAGVALAAVAYPLVKILYGDAYRAATLPLILLLPGVIAWSLAKVLSQYISYNRGRQWLPTLFSALGLALNVVLNYSLIARLGIAGASVASTISYGFVMGATYLAFRRLGRAA